MPSQKLDLTTIDISKLEKLEKWCHEWPPIGNTWGGVPGKHETYLLKTIQTDKAETQYHLIVSYQHDGTNWVEKSRGKFYRRTTKYLAIDGPSKGQWLIPDQAEYALYKYQYRGTKCTEFPQKVLMHTESLAKQLGLKW